MSDLEDPLAQSAESFLPTFDLTDTRVVPNLQPKIAPHAYRIAIIGEAPGKDEIEQGIPFIGWSGKDLDRYLSRFSILRDACFIGNVSRHHPPRNEFASFDWEGPQIQSGMAELRKGLAEFRPNICLLLGASALHAFKNPLVIPRKKKSKDGFVFNYPDSIGDWRGSFFDAHPNSPRPGCKCIATYHPAACMRQYSYTPYLLLDISRCWAQSKSHIWSPPKRDLRVRLSFNETLAELDKLMLSPDNFGTDIEGYWNFFRCISFAPTPQYSFIVPFTRMNGHSYWTVDEECAIMRKVDALLGSPRCKKTWQNGLYDRFCLQYGHGIISRGLNDDIMLEHWELHCELEKALSVQTSIYTDEPYYKAEIKADEIEDFHRYCCRDSAVTKEIHEKVSRWLCPSSRRHYEFNRTLLNPLLYMEIRGLRYNVDLAAKRQREIQHHICESQYDLDVIAGKALPTTDKVILRAIVRDTMCFKRDISKVKEDFKDVYDVNMRTLMGEADLTKAELGRLNRDLKRHLNTDSPKQVAAYLYTTLGLPTQYDAQKGTVTTDYEALITLRKKSKHPAIPILIDLGELLTRSGMLKIKADPDGRVRSSYNEVGSETGRITSSTSPTGSGYNLTTLPDDNELKPANHSLRIGMRDLIMADPGCYLAKCDLKGADGWTIGANLAALGDRTMLDDLLFGLKPAHFPCYVRRHGGNSIHGKSRPELVSMFKEIKKSDWDYFAAKQCTWGFFYRMGVRKAAGHVFNVSEGTVEVSESDMEVFRNVLFRRYNGPLWHNATEDKLFKQPYPPKMVSPSGHVREFWGRKTEIVNEALAHEPQSVTTYATNMAIYNCWTDRDNRYVENSRVRLRIEPMHQVHDEAVFQFKIDDTAWAVAKIRKWFDNPITIAGISITIPFEGSYGTNWAMDEHSKVGEIK